VESLALPDVLAEAGVVGLALVCEALLAAGVFCAITGAPKLAANKIAAIDPGITVLLFTLVPFRPKTKNEVLTTRTARFLS
jgi:hypothetical protein